MGTAAGTKRNDELIDDAPVWNPVELLAGEMRRGRGEVLAEDGRMAAAAGAASISWGDGASRRTKSECSTTESEDAIRFTQNTYVVSEKVFSIINHTTHP